MSRVLQFTAAPFSHLPNQSGATKVSLKTASCLLLAFRLLSKAELNRIALLIQGRSPKHLPDLAPAVLAVIKY